MSKPAFYAENCEVEGMTQLNITKGFQHKEPA